MVNREFADYELQPLSSGQIRDFGGRILHVIARRFGIDSAEKIVINYCADNELGEYSVHYCVAADEDDALDYIISIDQSERLDTSWSEEVIRQIFTDNADSNFGISYVDESGDEVDDPSDAVAIAYDGCFTTEHNYRFHIPRGRGLATASHTMNYEICDDDDELMAGETAYSIISTRDGGNLWALERLWYEGVGFDDLQVDEESLSQVTAADLEQVLKALQTSGLIGHRALALSKKYRNLN